MRFIGSKAHLLAEIDAILAPHLTGKEQTMVDLFAGSNVVGQHFKPRYRIISNDLMAFSKTIAEATLVLNHIPPFTKLHEQGIHDVFQYLQTTNLAHYPGSFVTAAYSPAGSAQRMYFTVANAKRIDFIRDKIADWRQRDLITTAEHAYLLNALLQAIPYVSNITGTYGAFLKHWDKRAFKPLELVSSPLVDNHQPNQAYQTDAVKLAHHLHGDIVYVDPPYNNRQYAPNYHVLETIARNDHPTLHGVTGQRDNTDQRSAFSMKRQAQGAMQELLAALTNFTHVVVSYSTDGIIPELDLLTIIRAVAKPGTITTRRIPYRKYKSKVVNPAEQLFELLFYFQPKDKIDRSSSLAHEPTENQTLFIPATIKTGGGLIKSPLNYIGGKYKLLPQILPLFPAHISTFVDLFSGGGNVGINVTANHVYFNDFNSKVNDLFRYFQGQNPQQLLTTIQRRIADYHLSKTNAAGFLQIRADYNVNPNPLDLYVLVAYSFNYQFRFNNHLQYNNPFGRNRSHFSARMAAHLVRFVNRLNAIDAHFTDHYFNQFDPTQLPTDAFVYADPPYLITTGSYNDGNRGFTNWTVKQEQELYAYLDRLDHLGIKFALSNVTDHKGKSNDRLKAWSQAYVTHVLNYDYKNASHNTAALGSREVLITNY